MTRRRYLLRYLTLHSMVPAIGKTVECEWWSAVELKSLGRSRDDVVVLFWRCALMEDFVSKESPFLALKLNAFL